MMSDVIRELFLPVCAFVEECYPESTQPPDQPGDPVQPYDGVFPNQGLSESCSALAAQRMDADPNGGTDECAVYAAIAWVLQNYPSCDGAVQLPPGACLSTARRCASDIIHGGCAYLASELPPSCGPFADSGENQAQPAPGN